MIKNQQKQIKFCYIYKVSKNFAKKVKKIRKCGKFYISCERNLKQQQKQTKYYELQ